MKILLNYLCAAVNTEYTVDLSDSVLNYDFIILTPYQHTGGINTAGRVPEPASIFPTFLGLPNNTAYVHGVAGFGSVYIGSPTPSKATVKCTTNTAAGIVLFGIKI